MVIYFLRRALWAQNPAVQQHSALDAELLGYLDGCITTNLQRQALPQPPADPQEAGSALQTDVLHSCLPTTTSKCFLFVFLCFPPVAQWKSVSCVYHEIGIYSHKAQYVVWLFVSLDLCTSIHTVCLSGALLGLLCSAERYPGGVQQRPRLHSRGTETYSSR